MISGNPRPPVGLVQAAPTTRMDRRLIGSSIALGENQPHRNQRRNHTQHQLGRDVAQIKCILGNLALGLNRPQSDNNPVKDVMKRAQERYLRAYEIHGQS